MVSWKSFGIPALGLMAACGLSATGELAVDGGTDTGLGGPSFEGGTTRRPDAATTNDATAHEDAKKDTGKDSAADTSHSDGTAHEASMGHDGASMDATTESGSSADSGDDVVDAHGSVDAPVDASGVDAGKDSGAHDAAIDASGGGIDAAAPPSSCGFPSYTYSCGSKSCGCNQLCDDSATCGACLPHFGTCTLDLHSCDSDFSSATACGGCGNICCAGIGTCSLSSGTYSCEPCF